MKETREAGAVTINKEVVTEQKTVDVPVMHEKGDCMAQQSRWALSALALMIVLATACSSGGADAYSGASRGNDYSEALAPQQYGGSHVGGTATGDTEAGAAFARWVLEQDPQREYITDAVVRNEQNLGVKVQPNITKGDLRQLLEALAQGMTRTFPSKPITVTAFYQSGDKLAEAHADPRTGEIQFR
jgi:hypothetical protein